MTRVLIPLSFAVGFIPVAILAVLYGWRTTWKATDTGKAMFLLFTTTAVSYGLSVAVLLIPWFRGEIGEWVRIVVRVAIGLVLWNVLRVFLKAQRSGRHPVK